jgi:hypothetical protein
MLRSIRLAALALATLAAPAASAAPPQDPAALVDVLEVAWAKADVEGYLAAWRFSSTEDRDAEKAFAQDELGAESVQLHIEALPATARQASRVRVPARFFAVNEPRGRVSQAMLVFERNAEGWAVIERNPVADIDGLTHLSLDPKGYKANGLTLRLPDIEVRMEEGTIFTAPAAVGPTVLVFSGRGVVEFQPRPATEQEQLRQYSGKTRLVQPIRTFFLRLHPSKFFEWLGLDRAVEDLQASARFASAQTYFDRHVGQLYVLDAPLPRSPWWLVPPVGDGALVFDGPKGPLTYALDANSPEGLSLLDRPNRKQVCLYALDGKRARYSDDDRRSTDVVNHDITVTFEPGLRTLRAEDTLRLAIREPTTSVRLRLHEGFAIESVTHPDMGPLLFFRVRGQDTVMVSLGSLGMGGAPEIELRVRYRGMVPASFVEDEVLSQIEYSSDDVPLEDIRVITNRTAWYPSVGTDDYATARIRMDVPAELNAVTGGRLVSSRVEGERRIVEYQLDQKGKYISIAVGRLVEGGTATAGSTTIHSFAVPRQRPDLNRRVDEARAILTYFETLFGPVPYPEMNLVVIERSTPGGHSPPGMIVLAERPALLRRQLRDDPASFWDIPGFFLAHELAHQWWGHGIAPENYHERWLSEAFAQYAAALWVRQSRGEPTFRSVLARMNKWALRMTDEGPISLGYRLGHVRGDPQVFRAVVYDKGALVLHLLRLIVGDDGFFTALKRIQADHRFTPIGTHDLQAALEATVTTSLSQYFDAWIDDTTLPTLTLRYATEPSGKTRVDLDPTDLPGPVPVAMDLVTGESRDTRRVSLPPTGGSWSFEGAPGVKEVVVRADELPLVRVRRDKRTPASYSR